MPAVADQLFELEDKELAVVQVLVAREARPALEEKIRLVVVPVRTRVDVARAGSEMRSLEAFQIGRLDGLIVVEKIQVLEFRLHRPRRFIVERMHGAMSGI